MAMDEIRAQFLRACRRALNEQNRDATAFGFGCFDRRHWAWKLVDYPEATFQRNVYPLAWLWRQGGDALMPRQALRSAVVGGLQFAARIQHRDGSFDQAFPHEHSFGATAFLLQALHDAYELIDGRQDPTLSAAVPPMLRRAADFLVTHDEAHGFISNHRAGAALSLRLCAQTLGESRYGERADELIRGVLDRQAGEGWFPEYEGADPGYQTLCTYYLARCALIQPVPRLDRALEASARFLAWFAHPDGSFGGEYGSRRTAVFYPGGFALLKDRVPEARALLACMVKSMTAGRMIAADTVDMGNLAPMLMTCISLLEGDADAIADVPPPWEQGRDADFPQAGLYVRTTATRRLVIGAGNGGVLKVFDRATGALTLNDGGYTGETDRGEWISSQHTRVPVECATGDRFVEVSADFQRMSRGGPSPMQFLVLRALNLTVMRNVALGNAVKRLLIRRLIVGNRPVGLKLRRRVEFTDDGVRVRDRLERTGPLRLARLSCGQPFVAIHMASARYFDPGAVTGGEARTVDVGRLNQDGRVEMEFDA